MTEEQKKQAEEVEVTEEVKPNLLEELGVIEEEVITENPSTEVTFTEDEVVPAEEKSDDQ